MNAALYLAWLVALVLTANAGVPAPDGLGLAVVGLTLWSLAYLYYGLCKRWPIGGWLGFGFIVGLFGGSSHSTTTTFVEREEYDDTTNCDTRACKNSTS